MKVLFDTSILVSSFVSRHPSHADCFPWLQQAEQSRIQGVISTHTLAEAYTVLTGSPPPSRLPPTIAQALLADLLLHFETVPLLLEDYEVAIARMVRLNLTGGGIYDALIAQAAVKASVDILLTLNPKHFTRLGDDIASLVQVPG